MSQVIQFDTELARKMQLFYNLKNIPHSTVMRRLAHLNICISFKGPKTKRVNSRKTKVV